MSVRYRYIWVRFGFEVDSSFVFNLAFEFESALTDASAVGVLDGLKWAIGGVKKPWAPESTLDSTPRPQYAAPVRVTPHGTMELRMRRNVEKESKPKPNIVTKPAVGVRLLCQCHLVLADH